MKKKLLTLTFLLFSCWNLFAQYIPTEANIKARKEFEGFRFGIFIHWGIYSEFAQGEWYLNSGKLQQGEYAKAASCFYPVKFNADQWVAAIKESGAKYITFTSRHHDGFSMYKTNENDYNIVDATPFKRDVLRELSDACQKQGIRLHVYYSILDWIREDYPLGRTGLNTGRNSVSNWQSLSATEKAHINANKYPGYFQFMKNQIGELIHNYHIDGLWFDGYWDHDSDSIPFDWKMPEFYKYIHTLKDDCLVGNNHHIKTIDGEDFQMFERDLPGENKAGYSENQEISTLPLEMCQTMNGMWGYKVADQDYKSGDQLIQLLVKAAAKGSNLLLNIGPQPNGELPATALDRLKDIGKWMTVYGESVYNTKKTNLPDFPWGVSTQNNKCLFIHVFQNDMNTIEIPVDKKPKDILALDNHHRMQWNYNKKKKSVIVHLPSSYTKSDYVVQIVK